MAHVIFLWFSAGPPRVLNCLLTARSGLIHQWSLQAAAVWRNWMPPHSPNTSSLVPLPTLLPRGSFSGSPSFWSHLLSREAFPDAPVTHGASGPILHELWLILHESPLQPTFLQLTNIYMAFKFYKTFSQSQSNAIHTTLGYKGYGYCSSIENGGSEVLNHLAEATQLVKVRD